MESDSTRRAKSARRLLRRRTATLKEFQKGGKQPTGWSCGADEPHSSICRRAADRLPADAFFQTAQAVPIRKVGQFDDAMRIVERCQHRPARMPSDGSIWTRRPRARVIQDAE